MVSGGVRAERRAVESDFGECFQDLRSLVSTVREKRRHVASVQKATRTAFFDGKDVLGLEV